MKRRVQQVRRPPIFNIGSSAWIDLFWYHEFAVEVDLAKLVNGLTKLDPRDFVIALRLSATEAQRVQRGRQDADEESVARLRTATDHVRAALGIKPELK